jgi:hypothetical protein
MVISCLVFRNSVTSWAYATTFVCTLLCPAFIPVIGSSPCVWMGLWLWRRVCCLWDILASQYCLSWCVLIDVCLSIPLTLAGRIVAVLFFTLRPFFSKGCFCWVVL